MVEEGWEECIEVPVPLETNMMCYHSNQKWAIDGQMWLSIAYFGIGLKHGWLGTVGQSSNIFGTMETNMLPRQPKCVADGRLRNL